MRSLLTQRIIQVCAEERLGDVSSLIERKSASHCIVLEEPKGAFLGVVRVRDALSKPPERIFADLLSSVPAYRVGRNVSRNSMLEIIQRDNLDEAVVLSNTGKFIGLLTPESVQGFQDKNPTLRGDAALRPTPSSDRIVAKLERQVREHALALKQAIAQLDDFSYAVSHDVRTPLRAMRGYAMALLDDYGPRLDESGKLYIQRIIRASDRLDRLTIGVLAYVEVSRTRVSLRKLSISRIVAEVIDAKRSACPAAEIHVQQPLGTVRADHALLVLCLSQIIDNALKFVPPGQVPSIRLWTEKTRGYNRLLIEDNGLGIRPENHARVFKLFEQLNPEQAYEGAGVGLALVQKAVEKMGGDVGIDPSETGSRFWIKLCR